MGPMGAHAALTAGRASTRSMLLCRAHACASPATLRPHLSLVVGSWMVNSTRRMSLYDTTAGSNVTCTTSAWPVVPEHTWTAGGREGGRGRPVAGGLGVLCSLPRSLRPRMRAQLGAYPYGGVLPLADELR